MSDLVNNIQLSVRPFWLCCDHQRRCVQVKLNEGWHHRKFDSCHFHNGWENPNINLFLHSWPVYQMTNLYDTYLWVKKKTHNPFSFYEGRTVDTEIKPPTPVEAHNYQQFLSCLSLTTSLLDHNLKIISHCIDTTCKRIYQLFKYEPLYIYIW